MKQDMRRRILIVDDDANIRQMMAGLLRNAAHNETSTTKLMRARLFQQGPPGDQAHPDSDVEPVKYDISMAEQGRRAYEMVVAAVAEGDPYLMCFLDMRMPPGWDGLETMVKLWEADPFLQVALCTAYSDYSWEDILTRAGRRQNLLILKKPFDFAEAAQMALALSEKGLVTRKVSERVKTLEEAVEERTARLAEVNSRLQAEILAKEVARKETADTLEVTVNAIAGVLVSMIEMGNPLAFSHAKRIKSHAILMATELGLPDVWRYELAAILSQIGCATIPEGVLRRYFSGSDLAFEEKSMILAYPQASAELIGKIQRLEDIAAMMSFRDNLGDASLFDPAVSGPVETGAWILRVAIDVDILLSRHSKRESLAALRRSAAEYPAILLDILDRKLPDEAPRYGSVSTIPLLSLEKDMVINHDIVAFDGAIVARKDQRMSEPLLKRIRNFIQAGQIPLEIVEIIERDERG